jgi:hypothetical protein
MFSAEKGQDLPFFGYWQLPDFLSFMTTTSNLLGSTDPSTAIFVDGNQGRGVPLANYGLYSLKQICSAWNIATYPGTADVIAPKAPQVALVRDTGRSTTDRITNDGRLTVASEQGASFRRTAACGGAPSSRPSPAAIPCTCARSTRPTTFRPPPPSASRSIACVRWRRR